MGVCKKIKRKDDQERNVWENISEKKEGRVLERTRQSMKRKISNDLYDEKALCFICLIIYRQNVMEL